MVYVKCVWILSGPYDKVEAPSEETQTEIDWQKHSSTIKVYKHSLPRWNIWGYTNKT